MSMMETKGVYLGEGNARFVLNNEPLVAKVGEEVSFASKLQSRREGEPSCDVSV